MPRNPHSHIKVAGKLRPSRRVAIVGHEGAKFTEGSEAKARRIIRKLLTEPTKATLMVSGHCPLGGVDIWAEEEADYMGIPMLIHAPEQNNWPNGFRPRNIKIARTCTEIHVIVVAELPPTFGGRRFPFCYHCNSDDHVKSGGCWTAHFARGIGIPAYWHIIP